MTIVFRALRTKNTVFPAVHKRTLLTNGIRMNTAWLEFVSRAKAGEQYDCTIEARREYHKLIQNSLGFDGTKQFHCIHSHRYQRIWLPSPTFYIRLRNLGLSYSTSSGFVGEAVLNYESLSASGDSTSLRKWENILNTEDKLMINLLIQYKARYNDCHVPTGNTIDARKERKNLGISDELADWVVKQRKYNRQSSAKKGQISDSHAAKIIILDSLGFMWSCREARWQRSFNKLEKIYRSHRDGKLFQIKEQDNPKLYGWMEQQRKDYRKGRMPIERENLLREINFVFDPSDTRWWENYRDLRRYYEEQGDTMVPLLNDDESPNYLGQWVARQRRLRRSNSLSDDRRKALSEIDFSWDPEAESWENHYNQLCEFHREHNHTRVPKSMGSLWNWVDRQRRSYRKRLRLRERSGHGNSEIEISRRSLITKENVQKLSSIGFDWEDASQKGELENRMQRLMDVTFELSIHDENWAKHFDKLCAFHKKYKHFSIPTCSGRYKELNTWVRHTRYLFNSKKLANNRVNLLDSIGFAWTAEDAKWDRLCEELFIFHEENGHCDIPTKNAELYRWKAKVQKEINDFGDHCDSVGSKAEIERKKRLQKLKIIFLS